MCVRSVTDIELNIGAKLPVIIKEQHSDRALLSIAKLILVSEDVIQDIENNTVSTCRYILYNASHAAKPMQMAKKMIPTHTKEWVFLDALRSQSYSGKYYIADNKDPLYFPCTSCGAQRMTPQHIFTCKNNKIYHTLAQNDTARFFAQNECDKYMEELDHAPPTLIIMKQQIISNLVATHGQNHTNLMKMINSITTTKTTRDIKLLTRGYSIATHINMIKCGMSETAEEYKKKHESYTQSQNLFLFDENIPKLYTIQQLLEQTHHTNLTFLRGDIYNWILELAEQKGESIYIPNVNAHFLQQLMQILWTIFFLHHFLENNPHLSKKI